MLAVVLEGRHVFISSDSLLKYDFLLFICISLCSALPSLPFSGEWYKIIHKGWCAWNIIASTQNMFINSKSHLSFIVGDTMTSNFIVSHKKIESPQHCYFQVTFLNLREKIFAGWMCTERKKNTGQLAVNSCYCLSGELEIWFEITVIWDEKSWNIMNM